MTVEAFNSNRIFQSTICLCLGVAIEITRVLDFKNLKSNIQGVKKDYLRTFLTP